MKKIAFFVEGYTELYFLLALLKTIHGQENMTIETHYQHKGIIHLETIHHGSKSKIFILIVNCRSDTRVKSEIASQYSSLIANGYSKIIGLMDIYPSQHNEIHLYQNSLNIGLPTIPYPPEIHLAILEIESWFFCDTNHFQIIDPSLTPAHILNNGFDIINTQPNSWNHPAKTLDNIYKIAGQNYINPNGRKKVSRIKRTINAISFDDLYLQFRTTAPELDSFINSIEDAIY